jgi:hypothetical protein
MCAQKAKFFHETLGLKGEFNGSVGWLTRFKQQYSICETAVQGERLSASDAAVGCYIWHILGMVLCKSSNAGLIIEETSSRSNRR